jgi:hypothetical protein
MNQLKANIKEPISNIPISPTYVKSASRTFFQKTSTIATLVANLTVFGV